MMQSPLYNNINPCNRKNNKLKTESRAKVNGHWTLDTGQVCWNIKRHRVVMTAKQTALHTLLPPDLHRELYAMTTGIARRRNTIIP